MSLFQEIGSMLSGQEGQRLASDQGDFEDPNSPDQQRLQAMLSRMDPQQLQQVMSQAASRMDPQAYAQHITPGAGGTNPLGAIGGGGLSTIASTLIQHLGGAGAMGGLLSRIPGLQTTNPSQMDENQVAALARYAQQNHPDAFGSAAAQIGQQQPGLLNSFLGKAGLAVGAAALASHFMKNFQ